MPVPPSAPVRSRRLRAASGAVLTYPEVGASLARLPAGYRHVRRVHHLGDGMELFHACAERLLTWQMHRRAGVRVEATDERARAGTVVVLRLGPRPVGLTAPCRVVVRVDEPRRQGFAYGTLPGHPETGEEAFLVTRDDRDRVMLRIDAFSRPATVWVRAGGPVTRRVQDRMLDRYAAALPPPAR